MAVEMVFSYWFHETTQTKKPVKLVSHGFKVRCPLARLHSFTFRIAWSKNFIFI